MNKKIIAAPLLSLLCLSSCFGNSENASSSASETPLSQEISQRETLEENEETISSSSSKEKESSEETITTSLFEERSIAYGYYELSSALNEKNGAYEAETFSSQIKGVDNPNPKSITNEGSNLDAVLQKASMEGYRFEGWFRLEQTDSDDASLKWRAYKLTSLREGYFGTVVYGLFSKYYSLSVSSCNEDAGSASFIQGKGGSACVGDGVGVMASPKKGYAFAGWYVDDTKVSDDKYYSFAMEAKDLSLVAKWKAISYDIVYELSGGENNEENVSTYTIEDTIYLKDPTREGYEFKGWYEDERYSKKVFRIEEGSTGTEHLYAKWEAIQYEITYELEGGTNNEANPDVYTIEQSVSLLDPSRPGYKFEGWYSDSSYITPRSYIPLGSTGEKVFYAKWSAIGYAISYELNGGVNDPDNPVSFTVEDNVSLKNPTKVGYTFKGWYLDESYSTKVTSLISGTIGDVTLCAKWEAISYSITYNLNKGTNSANNPKTYTIEDNLTFEAPSRTGYTFDGWYADSEYTSKVESIEAGSTGALTLYAKWVTISYAITYDYSGGEEVTNPTSYTIEDSVTLASPTREGYYFAGWYNGSKKVASIAQGTTGDLSLVARWNPISYSIYYYLDGGTNASGNPRTYNIESSEINLLDPTRDGYTFAGWYSNSSLSTSCSSIPAGSMGNRGFYAKWTANKQSLTVSSSDSSKGSVAVTKGEGYTDESVTVVAAPAEDCVFKGWYCDDKLLSSSKTYTFKMPAGDYSLTALFWTNAEEEAEQARRKALGIDPVIDTENNTLTYGLYPQTYVSDTSTIASLNRLAASSVTGWTYYSGNYYAKAKANPYGTNYAFSDGTTIVSDTTYWFKCELITWKILSSTNKTYSLVSTVLLDAQRYNEKYTFKKNGYYANDYSNSEIRKWLIGDFYKKAFLLGNSLIQTVKISNSYSASGTIDAGDTYAGTDTNDKVYLLSVKDYMNADYGFYAKSTWSSTRDCTPSDWARANHAYYSKGSGAGYYWTRTPYNNNAGEEVNAVYHNGYLAFQEKEVNLTYFGVRPGITIKVS